MTNSLLPTLYRTTMLWALPTMLSITVATTVRANPVIHEIMYHPAHSAISPENLSKEFIELYNPTAEAIDLTGWTFTKGVSFTFPTIEIEAGGYVVIAADTATFLADYPGFPVSSVVGGWTGQLSNSGERIELSNTSGVRVDSVRYYDEGDWALRRRGPDSAGTSGWIWEAEHDGDGSSLELRNPALRNDLGQNWEASTVTGGTPGTTNSVTTTETSPFITGVIHSPAVPDSSDPVTVTAQVIGGESATLLWRASTPVPPAFNGIPMTDNGTGGDTTAGDGIYTATIPARPDGTIIEFYVRATTGAATRTWPAPTDASGSQGANALYQVDPAPRETGRATYRLITTSPELATFDAINRGSNAQMNATFIADGPGGPEIRYRCGFRIRGNSSRGSTPPPIRLNIPTDTPWEGVTRLNLNSVQTWSQHIGLLLFSASGLPSPASKPVRVSFNGQDRSRNNSSMYGLYVHVQPPNSAFLKQTFPADPDGNLYRKRSANPNRDRKRWGVHNERTRAYQRQNWFLTDQWDKQSNTAAFDWTDLQEFVETMDRGQVLDPDDIRQIGEHIDTDQWLRWFAVMVLLANRETNLSNGIDDDYAIYRGINDPRFVLIPHDLDTILDLGLGATSTLFPMIESLGNVAGDDRIPQLIPFMRHPDIVPRYYTQLRDLLDSTFSKTQFDTFVTQNLSGWVPQSQINTVISWMDQRRSYIAEQITAPFTVASPLPLSGGLPLTTSPEATLSGTADLVETERVSANGNPATLDRSTGVWQIALTGLNPGINRITIQFFGPGDTLVATRTFDVWYNNGDTAPLSGTLSTDTTLTASGGPYLVDGDLTVPTGTTLTIEPGTTVYFEPDSKITVRGLLECHGSEFARIRMTGVPGATPVPDIHPDLPLTPPKWDGIKFVQSGSQNRGNMIAFTDIEHAQDLDGSIGLDASWITVDRCTFSGSRRRYLYAEQSAVTLTGSTFPDMFLPGEVPQNLGFSNISEHIKSTGAFPAGGHFTILGNTFGTNSGYNDVVDIDSGRVGGSAKILQVIDNVFAGARDEILDLGGDAYVAGNIFMNVFKDDNTADLGYANAISTGDAGGDTLIVVARNIFWDIDHAINLKRDASTIFENNTVVKVHDDFIDVFGNTNVGSAINLYVDEPGATSGKGAYAAGNIFQNIPRVFGNADLPAPGTTSELEFENNFLDRAAAASAVDGRPGTIIDLGPGNLTGNPLFKDGDAGDFELLPGSLARGTAPLGLDFGGLVPGGITVTGRPAAVTAADSAVLTVGGPGMFRFQYRVNGAPWGNEQPIGNGFDPGAGTVRTGTISLTGLAPGTYTVEVRGLDFAGELQEEPPASVTWTVDPSHSQLFINEFLADNGDAADFVELFNDSSTAVQLGSENPNIPRKFVFPAGTEIPAGGYLVFASEGSTDPDIPNLGFSLSAEGESLHLYDRPETGGDMIDMVIFGIQLPGLSLGRDPRDRTRWRPGTPTFGSSNSPLSEGDPYSVKINEWMSSPQVHFREDFIELYNPGDLPAAIGGFFLTDDPVARPGLHRIADLSFIPARGFVTFQASGDPPSSDASQLNFKLAARGEWIALSDPQLREVDKLNFVCDEDDLAQGRVPDGGTEIFDLELPTPGLANLALEIQTEEIIPIDTTWTYDQSDTNFFTSWKESNFNDSTWLSGAGLFHLENSPLPGPKNTLLRLNPPTTHYFRHRFTYTGDPALTELVLEPLADDGIVLYLNGTEVRRLRMPPGPVGHGTFATTGVGNAVFDSPFTVPSGILTSGENVLAASVHQDDGNSSDVVFGLRATAETATLNNSSYSTAIQLLRGFRLTEIMYAAPEGDSLGFLEFTNIGDTPLDLTGVRISDGVEFTFPNRVLEPGEFVIVAANPEAFLLKYDSSLEPIIVGPYSKNLSANGEDIRIQLPVPLTAAIIDFEYDGDWYPEATGGGRSIITTGLTVPPSLYGDRASWMASPDIEGSPGNNGPPQLTGIFTVSGKENIPFFYQITASNGPRSYGASGLPSGLLVDSETGEITGIPTVFGTFTVVVQATNISGTTSADLTITLAEQLPPEITSAETAFGQVNIPFIYEITATEQPSRFSATGLPGWASVDQDTGAISGTPPETGISEVSVSAENPKGTASISLTITISEDPFSTALDIPGIAFTTGGNTQWTTQSTVTYDGVDAARAGTIGNNRQSWLEMNVSGPDFLVFWWKVSSERNFDFLRLELDGLTQFQISGEVDWERRSLLIPEGEHTIRWTYLKDGSALDGADTAWLDEVFLVSASSTPLITSPTSIRGLSGVPFSYQITALNSPTQFGVTELPEGITLNPTTGLISGIPLATGITATTITATNNESTGTAPLEIQILPTLTDSLDTGTLLPVTPESGAAPWFGQLTTTNDGVDAAQSGDITDDEATWMSADIAGPGTLAFSWSVSSESNFDFLRFELDREELFAISGTVPWRTQTVTIPDGVHQIRWGYTKDGSVSSNEDTGWVDEVVLSGYAAWVRENDLPIDQVPAVGDFDGDGIANLVEYGLGLDPRSKDSDELFLPVLIGDEFLWLVPKNPDATGVTTIAETSDDLTPGSWTGEELTIVIENETLMLVSTPLDAAAHRFFRVRVTTTR